MPASLVYSTPYAGTWNAYCDALSHSLVVIDGTRNAGMIVYTYNEMTKSINRQTVTDWTLFEKFMFTNMTFSSKLPLDIIEVCDRSKARRGKVKDTYINISGARYFKSRIKDDADFPTCLPSQGCWLQESMEEEHLQQSKKAGLVPHQHCKPLFSYPVVRKR